MYEEKALTKNLLSYATGLSCKEANLLGEEAVAKCLITDKNVQLTDCKIVDVMNANRNNSDNSDGNDDSASKCLQIDEEA
jgi:hypothetical protein